MNEFTKTLRKKFVNSNLVNKTCGKCNKNYPRTKEFFYATKHSSIKGAFNFESICITCSLEKSKKWKENNRSKNSETHLKYKQTEKGHFKEMWHGVRKSRHGNEFKSYEEFFQCWEEQKKIYGTKCPYLGIEMTIIKGLNLHGERRKQSDTNISKDRILSSRPYSKQNLMFVSWKANNEKGNVSPKIAKRYIEFVKQRFETDEIE